MHESGHDAQLLFHALAHLFDAALGRQFEHLQQLRLAAAARTPPVALDKVQELLAGHIVKKADLSGDVPQLPLDALPLAPAIHSVNAAGARFRADESHQMADGGGLSRAVRPEEAEHFALPHPEGQIKHALSPAVIAGQALHFQHAHHSSSLYA